MEVRDVSLSESGELMVRVAVQTPQLLTVLGGQVRVGRGGRVRVVAGSNGGPVADANPAVVDADGKNLPVTKVETRPNPFGDGSSVEITLTCQTSKAGAESARLVYSGPRTHVIQVPFTLKDVPLP
jgi:hypothetical protein